MIIIGHVLVNLFMRMHMYVHTYVYLCMHIIGGPSNRITTSCFSFKSAFSTGEKIAQFNEGSARALGTLCPPSYLCGHWISSELLEGHMCFPDVPGLCSTGACVAACLCQEVEHEAYVSQLQEWRRGSLGDVGPGGPSKSSAGLSSFSGSISPVVC